MRRTGQEVAAAAAKTTRMRTRLLAPALTAALLLSGGALAGAEEPTDDPTFEQFEFFPLFTDRAGDATAFVVEDVMPASEDTLDLRVGQIGFDHGTETLVFEVGVEDLTELPPSAAVGKTFYVNFAYAGSRYFVTATEHAVEGASFGLGTFNDQGFRRGLSAAEVTGEFNHDGDIVRVELSADAFTAAVPDAPRFAEGQVISASDVLAQRYIGSRLAGGATPTADTANARSFKIPPAPASEEVEGDAEGDGGGGGGESDGGGAGDGAGAGAGDGAGTGTP